MTPTTATERDPSFAETALRLSGKSEGEASRMGAVDKADEQVETLFLPQYQTVNSPIHKAIWDGKTPLDLFVPPALPASHPADAVMEKSIDVVRRRHANKTLLDANNKLADDTLAELGGAGYWGLLTDPKHGGSGVPFARFG